MRDIYYVHIETFEEKRQTDTQEILRSLNHEKLSTCLRACREYIYIYIYIYTYTYIYIYIYIYMCILEVFEHIRISGGTWKNEI
jgi:hypothetical protein